jgi:hypothetical protein
MIRHTALALFASLVIAIPVARAQQKSVKDQLAGAWTLSSIETTTKDGAKISFMEGGTPKGLLVFAGDRFSFQVIGEYPKLASNDRLKTTPQEEKAIAHNVLSYFGTYSLSEGDKVLTLKIEASSFPNQVGSSGKRNISLTGDELKLENPASLAGNMNRFTWKRAN